MRKWILISTLALAVIFCNLSAPTATAVPPTLSLDSASTVVAAASATAEAQATSTPEPSPSVPATGTITGKLSYPSEGVPAMRVVAFDVSSGKTLHLDTAGNQSTYTFDLPVGVYHIVAYPISSGTFGGGYTKAVPCGLTVECSDHTLVEVTVTAGTTTPNIDPGDFYAPEGSFPPMPAQ